MTRRLALIAFAWILNAPGQNKKLRLRVTVPHIAKQDILGIMSDFFGRGDERAKQKIAAVIDRVDELTLVMTTAPGDTIEVELL